MKASRIPVIAFGLASLCLPACHSTHAEEHRHEEHNKIVCTSPEARDVIITQQYVCQIRSQKHIEVKALTEGYLEQIPVKEGQAVKKGDVLFRVLPALYKARYESELAEVRQAEVEFFNTQALAQKKVVSDQEVKIYEAKLNRAKAKAAEAEAELNFTVVRAPFDGIVDRLYQQQGSLVKKEDLLTTLSDNSTMWVYFNVPEARYLDYVSHLEKNPENPQQLKLTDSKLELILANGSKFDQHAGDMLTIEGKFNNETGNIAFRADFPNPDRLLRHGQTGTIQINRKVKHAVVIPQRATFEILDRRYVWVVGDDHVAHQRPITVEHELEDIFVLKTGVTLKDKIVLEGVQQVHEGEKLEFEFEKPGEALARQKQHAE